jgi:hypothetical protein
MTNPPRAGSRQAVGGGARYAAIGGGGTPSTIFGANLIVWTKADTGVTLSGSNVTAWADQSGNGHDFGVENASPTFSGSGFNGLSGITFTTTQGLKTAGFNISSNVAGFFVVGNFTTSTGANARILAYFDPIVAADYNSVAHILALNNVSSGNIDCLQNSVSSTAMAVTTGTNVRLGLTFNGPTGNVNSYVNNGAPTTTGGFGNNTLGGSGAFLDLGFSNAGSGVPFTAAEMVVVNIVPSSGQLTSLDNYFKSKWGL